jgi:hypothetical protein
MEVQQLEKLQASGEPTHRLMLIAVPYCIPDADDPYRLVAD